MRRIAAIFFFVSMVLTAAAGAPAGAQDIKEPGEFLSSLVGTYDVIGRFPDSRKTYSGEVNISRDGNRLVLERKINGVKTTCEASLQAATADRIPVIRASWKQGKIEYGATYLVHTDLDNYPRLTGYVYRAGKGTATSSPGLEALFIKQAQIDAN